MSLVFTQQFAWSTDEDIAKHTCQQQVCFAHLRCLGSSADLAFNPESLILLAFAAPWGEGCGCGSNRCRHRCRSAALHPPMRRARLQLGAARECDGCRLTNAAADSSSQVAPRKRVGGIAVLLLSVGHHRPDSGRLSDAQTCDGDACSVWSDRCRHMSDLSYRRRLSLPLQCQIFFTVTQPALVPVSKGYMRCQQSTCFWWKTAP